MIHCLHGAVGSFRDWDLLRQNTSEPIHPVDLWQFFRHSTPSLAETGQWLCDSAKQDDILLGYSMGGRLALHALLASPQKWKAAIIVSAHPGLREGQEERRKRDEEWARHSENDWGSFLEHWNQQGILNALPKGLHQAEPKDQKSVSQSFLHWSLGNQENLRPQLPMITCPVLWITGANDPKFRALAEEATPLLPNAEHLEIDDAGHRVPWDQPAQFRTMLQAFLQRIPSP